MSETATIEPPSAPAAPVSFRDVIASAMQGVASEPAAPEPEAPPAAPVAEPKVTPPADPLKELSTPETPEFKLPIDEDEPEKAAEDPDTSEIKAGRRIKELKDEVKTKWQPKVAELEQDKAQLESRLAEMEAKIAAVEELETKVKTYEEEMSVVKLEKHPKYVQEVREPLKAKVAEATAIAEAYDIPIDGLLDALEAKTRPEAKKLLREVTSGLGVDEIDLSDLLKIHSEITPILAKRDKLLSKADQALAELQVAEEKESQQKALARAEERKQIVPAITERLMVKLGFIKDDLPAMAEATAATDLDALNTPNLVYNHMAGLSLPKVLAKASAIQRENDRLLDEIESLKKALPRLDGGLTSSGGTTKPKNFLEAMKRDLGKS